MIAGRKPKEDDQKVTRVPLTQEWIDVPYVPFEGCQCDRQGGPACKGFHVPRLPGAPNPKTGRATPMPALTRGWWAVVSTMPHCSTWRPGEWQFAVETALVHAAFARGDMSRAQELRVREAKMGMTEEGRRDQRIRYVLPATRPSAEPGADADGAEVTDFAAERRRRLMNHAD